MTASSLVLRNLIPEFSHVPININSEVTMDEVLPRSLSKSPEILHIKTKKLYHWNIQQQPPKKRALGYPFAAGLRAGGYIDRLCMRASNAYPQAMQGNERMPVRGDPDRGPSKPSFTFKACTGDVTTDLPKKRKANISWALYGKLQTLSPLRSWQRRRLQ